MNISKPVDYSKMYEMLSGVISQKMSQMEAYCEIGRIVSTRTEKGAAVAAAEYLQSHYPECSGFSPRNLRRMRDFYKTYQNVPEVLKATLDLGWTLNVIIVEADLSMEERTWYIAKAAKGSWTKTVLIQMIETDAYSESLDNDAVECEHMMTHEIEHEVSEVKFTTPVKCSKWRGCLADAIRWHKHVEFNKRLVRIREKWGNGRFPLCNFSDDVYRYLHNIMCRRAAILVGAT